MFASTLEFHVSSSSDVLGASPFTATCVEYRCDNLCVMVAE